MHSNTFVSPYRVLRYVTDCLAREGGLRSGEDLCFPYCVGCPSTHGWYNSIIYISASKKIRIDQVSDAKLINYYRLLGRSIKKPGPGPSLSNLEVSRHFTDTPTNGLLL